MNKRYVIIYDTFSGEYDRITADEYDNIRHVPDIVCVGYDWGEEF